MIELNGYKVEPTIFPDGTSQVWQLPKNVLEDCMTYEVTWWFENEAELMHLAQLRELLWHQGKPAALKMPYLPYARQDKAVDNEHTFAMSVFRYILGGMKWDYMCAYDAHCDLEQYFPDISNIEPDLSWITEEEYATVVFPDKSAWHRYKDIVPNKRQLFAEKVRDQSTGYITNYELAGSLGASLVSPAIVVDDLCDGGATFNILADSIGDKCPSLDLYVTHGIFSKGLSKLLVKYDRIFTTTTCYGADIPHNPGGFVTYSDLRQTASLSVDNERKYSEFIKYVAKGRLIIEEII